MGGETISEHQKHEPMRTVPHPRTLRKAREQVKHMVIDEVSPRRIRHYLHRWITWWVNTSSTWPYQELCNDFIKVCWNESVAAYAAGIYQLYLNKLHTRAFSVVDVAA
jgi:hypothetical protein